jgi:hypothetical protein
MPSLTDHVRAALGAAYDPKAGYVVVRPSMVGTPKYADCERMGEFVEDTRNETTMVVLRRPPAPAKPAPVPVSAAKAPVPPRSVTDIWHDTFNRRK